MQPLVGLTDLDETLIESVINDRTVPIRDVERCYRDEYGRDVRRDLASFLGRNQARGLLATMEERRRAEMGGTCLQQAIDKVTDRRDKPVSALDLETKHATSTNNRLEPLVGRDVADALFADIDAAKSSVHILNLEFMPGVLTDALTEKLIDKHEAGVKVRVLTDQVGARQIYSGNRKLLSRIKAAGIEVHTNATIPNGLEHRKLFIVDGAKAYVGGWCLRDESVMPSGVDTSEREHACLPIRKEGCAEFHDYMLRATGDVVNQLQVEFCLGWRWHYGELDANMDDQTFRSTYFPPAPARRGAKVRVARAIPGVSNDVMSSMTETMKRAETTLDVEVAYALRPEFFDVLCERAKAGVQVRLLVPGEPDNESYDYTLKSHYAEMLAAGVEIWHHRGYNHGKVVVADQRHVWLGSSNPEVVFSAPHYTPSNAFDTALVVNDPKVGRAVHETICARDFTDDRAERIFAPPQLNPWQRVKQFAFSTVFGML